MAPVCILKVYVLLGMLRVFVLSILVLLMCCVFKLSVLNVQALLSILKVLVLSTHVLLSIC